MLNPLDIYARASQRLALTPSERALLKTVDALVLTAAAGAVVAVIRAWVAGAGTLTFASLRQVAEYAFASALIFGAAKLFRARGDALGSAVAGGLDQAGTAIVKPLTPAIQPLRSGMLAPRRNLSGSAVNPSGIGQSLSDSLPRSRADLLRQAGGATITDQETRPIRSVNPASSGSIDPREHLAVSLPSRPVPATSAPSQTVKLPAEHVMDDLERAGDGPPTLQTPIVRPSSAPQTPAADAASSDWLTKP